MTGNRATFARLAASAAVLSLALSGCAMGGGNARPSDYAAKPLSGKKADKAVASAEKAVLAAPRDAVARASLGSAYLDAGRFASATQAFDDALELGDERPATVLGLVLAVTAEGKNDEALQLLADWTDVLPAADLGLAYALAGDTQRGVAILTDALRSGEATPKVRQNLAYAFALGGQWREARLMVGQDVPADQVDARLGEWAMMGRPEDVRTRVAHLIGANPVADEGQPQALALANFPDSQQFAAEAQAQTAPALAQAEPAPAVVAEVVPAELPLQAAPAPEPVRVAAAELPAVAPAAAPFALARDDRPAASVSADASAFAAIPLPPAKLAAPVKPRFVGKFVQPAKAPVVPGKGKGLAAMPAFASASGKGAYWVQLGSYTDPAIAKEGWGKFSRRTPALKGYKSVTTTAMVEGVKRWRVAATGFGSYDDAAKLCASVKKRGGACLVKRAESQLSGGGRALAALRR